MKVSSTPATSVHWKHSLQTPFGTFAVQIWLSVGTNAARIAKYVFASGQPSIYDRIIEHGRVVMVSIGPEDPGMGKMLCTLASTASGRPDRAVAMIRTSVVFVILAIGLLAAITERRETHEARETALQIVGGHCGTVRRSTARLR